MLTHVARRGSGVILVNFLYSLLMLGTPPGAPSSHEAADREFSRMNYRQAIILYKSVLPTSPDSTIVLWRMARALICLADTSAWESRLALYHEANSYATRSVGSDSMNSDAHTWLAAAVGNVAMFEGGKTKVKLCRVIKNHLDAAIRLEPTNDVAYSILGSFYKALGDVSWLENKLATIFLGGLPDGGYQEAEAAFRKAIALAPNVIRNHYEMGKLYMEQDRTGEALAEFRKVLTLPVTIGKDIPMQDSARQIASSLAH